MSELIYLASPYSHPDPAVRQARFEAACKQAALMMRAGLIVFSPLAHSHSIAIRHDLPGDWEFWKRQCERCIKARDKVVMMMLEGFQLSQGMMEEFAIATEIGIPIEYWELGECR